MSATTLPQLIENLERRNARHDTARATVQRMIDDNADPRNTFFGVLNPNQVDALEVLALSSATPVANTEHATP